MTRQTQSEATGRRSLVDRLVHRLPWWSDIWLDHQRAYGRQAPEAFLRTVAYMGAGRIAAGESTDGLPVDDTFGFLESEFGADSSTDSLIAGSFLANLPGLDLIDTDPIGRLGSKLRAELERHRTGGGIPVASPDVDFVRDLAASHRVVARALREHLADEDGELLPHMFMADLIRAATEWLRSEDGRAVLASVLASFEDAYGHDYEVDELIATGFVEALPYPHDKGAELLAMLGPKLRAEYNLERPAYKIEEPLP